MAIMATFILKDTIFLVEAVNKVNFVQCYKNAL